MSMYSTRLWYLTSKFHQRHVPPREERTYRKSSRIPNTISKLFFNTAILKPNKAAGGHTINIAESTRLALLRMMQTSRPVHRNIAFISTQTRGALYHIIHNIQSAPAALTQKIRTHRPSSRYRAIIKQPIKHRTVVSHIIYTPIPKVRSDSLCSVE